MKSFKEFVVEKRTTPGFGSPSGYDPQGEPKYTKRPGPREKGRRAGVQSSPKSVTAVKGEIEAAKGFETKSGGLDTRPTDPKYTPKRIERAANIGGDVWKDPTPAPGRPFKKFRPAKVDVSTSRTLRTKTGGSGRDWLASLRGPTSSKTDPWKGQYSTSYEVGEKIKASRPPSATEPFGDTGFDPHGSQKGSPTPKKPEAPKTEVVKQSDVSRRAKEFRKTNLSKRGGALARIGGPADPQRNLYRQFLNIVKNKQNEVKPVTVRDISNTTKLEPKQPKLDPIDVVPNKPKRLAGTPRKPSAERIQKAVTAGNKARKSKELASVVKGPSEFGKKVRGLGKFTGPAAAGLDVALGYADERAKGASKKRSLAKGVTKALGGALGGTLGAVGGGGLGSAALGVAGYTAGSALAGKAFDVAAGATAKQKAEIAKQSRVKQKMQSVVRPTKTTTVQSGDIVTRRTAVDPTKLAKTKVIRDKSGKERVGYLVKKGGTYGYKTGTDPSTLAKTSSNPLERIGRTFFPGAYVQSDEAARKKRVAALKAKG